MVILLKIGATILALLGVALFLVCAFLMAVIGYMTWCVGEPWPALLMALVGMLSFVPIWQIVRALIAVWKTRYPLEATW